MTRLLRFLACLPLPWMQRVGALLGWLVWVLSPTYRRHFKAQSTQAGYRFSEVRAAVAAAGCQTLESFRVWFGAPMPVSWDGLQHIEAAYAKGQGVVFLTPHLGCYEITAPTCAALFGERFGPLTVLYRPARQAWLRELLSHARERAHMRAVPTNMDGVRQLIKALRRGEAIGLLPDQVPPEGMGIWSQMWGRDAYTMTLGARLALQTQAEVVMAWGERLPHAKGYCIHVEPLGHDLDPDLGQAVRQLNHAMERLIRQSPGQYLWGYGRFKQPRQEGLT
jgi:KDO2-lipid IV(A) lauroyltransferase